MICRTCNTQLPTMALTCPGCGTPISTSHSEASTTYSRPSNLTLQPQPYNVPPQTPIYPPARKQGKGFRRGIVVGVVVVALLVIGGSIGVFLRQKPSNNTTSLPSYQRLSPLPSGNQGTAIVQQNLYSKSGNLVLDDPLTSDIGGFWDNTGGCDFTSQGLHLTSDRQQIAYCLAWQTHYTNFAYEAQITINKGEGGGLIFRDAVHYRHYYFYINNDGSFGLETGALDSSNQYQINTLKHGTTTLIKPNQPNLMAVVANNTTLDLYINHQKVGSVIDATYSTGRIGLGIHERNGEPTDVTFSNVRLWVF